MSGLQYSIGVTRAMPDARAGVPGPAAYPLVSRDVTHVSTAPGSKGTRWDKSPRTVFTEASDAPMYNIAPAAEIYAPSVANTTSPRRHEHHHEHHHNHHHNHHHAPTPPTPRSQREYDPLPLAIHAFRQIEEASPAVTCAIIS